MQRYARRPVSWPPVLRYFSIICVKHWCLLKPLRSRILVLGFDQKSIHLIISLPFLYLLKFGMPIQNLHYHIKIMLQKNPKWKDVRKTNPGKAFQWFCSTKYKKKNKEKTFNVMEYFIFFISFLLFCFVFLVFSHCCSAKT